MKQIFALCEKFLKRWEDAALKGIMIPEYAILLTNIERDTLLAKDTIDSYQVIQLARSCKKISDLRDRVYEALCDYECERDIFIEFEDSLVKILIEEMDIDDDDDFDDFVHAFFHADEQKIERIVKKYDR